MKTFTLCKGEKILEELAANKITSVTLCYRG